MEQQPPIFTMEVEYEYESTPRILELPLTSTVVTDYSMDSWGSKVKKVAGGIRKALWCTANRWRKLAARQAVDMCQSRRDTEQFRREAEGSRREVERYRREMSELRHGVRR